MDIPDTYNSLCLPSQIYFMYSMVVLLLVTVIILFFGFPLLKSKGIRRADSKILIGGTILFVIFSILVSLFWTYIINLTCESGYMYAAWGLLFFLLIVGMYHGSSVP